MAFFVPSQALTGRLSNNSITGPTSRTRVLEWVSGEAMARICRSFQGEAATRCQGPVQVGGHAETRGETALAQTTTTFLTAPDVVSANAPEEWPVESNGAA